MTTPSEQQTPDATLHTSLTFPVCVRHLSICLLLPSPSLALGEDFYNTICCYCIVASSSPLQLFSWSFPLLSTPFYSAYFNRRDDTKNNNNNKDSESFSPFQFPSDSLSYLGLRSLITETHYRTGATARPPTNPPPFRNPTRRGRGRRRRQRRRNQKDKTVLRRRRIEKRKTSQNVDSIRREYKQFLSFLKRGLPLQSLLCFKRRY